MWTEYTAIWSWSPDITQEEVPNEIAEVEETHDLKPAIETLEGMMTNVSPLALAWDDLCVSFTVFMLRLWQRITRIFKNDTK